TGQMVLSVASDTRHITFEGTRETAQSAMMTVRDVRLQGPRSSEPKESILEDDFPAWLLRESGIKPEAYRAKSILRRIPACLRQLRVESSADALQQLRRNPQLVPLVLNTLLIGVTGFF